MRTHFACPTCRAPLIVRFVAASITQTELSSSTRCPNPFCRTELPARHDKAALVYALVGKGAEIDMGQLVELKR